MKTQKDQNAQDEARREAGLRSTDGLGLPTPRLQFTWLPLNDTWTAKECLYTLVLPLRKLDIRSEDENGKSVKREFHCRIGMTTSTGGRRPVFDERVDTPFRDGAHARWDSEVLGGLPIYAVCEDAATRLGSPNEKLTA